MDRDTKEYLMIIAVVTVLTSLISIGCADIHSREMFRLETERMGCKK